MIAQISSFIFCFLFDQVTVGICFTQQRFKSQPRGENSLSSSRWTYQILSIEGVKSSETSIHKLSNQIDKIIR